MPEDDTNDTEKHKGDPAQPRGEGRADAREDGTPIDPSSEDLPFSNDRLCELWSSFRPIQRQFVIARLENPSDKAAAHDIGVSKHTPWSWDDKQLVNEAVELFINEMAQARRQGLHEGAHIAIERLKEILRTGDDRAAVKAGKLFIEQVEGKATQKQDINVSTPGVDEDALNEAQEQLSDIASEVFDDEEDED